MKFALSNIFNVILHYIIHILPLLILKFFVALVKYFQTLMVTFKKFEREFIIKRSYILLNLLIALLNFPLAFIMVQLYLLLILLLLEIMNILQLNLINAQFFNNILLNRISALKIISISLLKKIVYFLKKKNKSYLLRQLQQWNLQRNYFRLSDSMSIFKNFLIPKKLIISQNQSLYSFSQLPFLFYSFTLV